MTKYELNINYYMHVKLTEFGKQKIIEKCGPDYFKYCIEGSLQPDGYYKLQTHTVMNLLGEYCYNGARDLPFNLNVYFTSDDLKVLEPNTARWIPASTKPGVHAGMKCSACKARITYREHNNGQHLFCHKCGARMENG